ncbi:replication initiation protein [Pseudomonas fluorescens]|nr:replication initiation protein [Pseudomonas fluorescens]MBD8615303.1 replication initiation protein [Pseudomonas putida]MBD8682043.1 replication initiation protein [Pseudomonas sp. CFBP 13719]
MAHNSMHVYKSNELITAGYKLTVNEMRIILCCITQIDRNPHELITDEHMYGFTARDFAELCGISLMAAYQELKESVAKLYERSVRIQVDGKRDRNTRWIQTADYLQGCGRVEVRFSKDILPYLANLKGNFTKYRLEAVARLQSSHAVRIYELIVESRYKQRGVALIPLENLRFALQLADAYPVYADLRKRVIEPALEQINTFSDLRIIKFEPKRESRKIVAIEIQYVEKDSFGLPVQEELLILESGDQVIEGKISARTVETPKKRRANAKITEAEINKAARPGESREDVMARLKRQHAAA